MNPLVFAYTAVGAVLRAFLGFLGNQGFDFSKFSLGKAAITVVYGVIVGTTIAFGAHLDSTTAQLLAGFAGSEALKKALDFISSQTEE